MKSRLKWGVKWDDILGHLPIFELISKDESSKILVSRFACAEIIIDSSSAKLEVEF